MIARIGLRVWAVIVLVWLIAPVIIVVPLSVSDGSGVSFPPHGFSLQWYERLLTDESWLQALRTSAIVAICSSLLAVIAGSLLAHTVARRPGRVSKALRSISMGPMVVPTIVLSVSIYLLWAKIGIIGTLPGLVIAHATVALPFVLMIMVNAVSSVDPRIEQAAASLGASRTQVLLRVLLPTLVPHLSVAWLFAFIVSFDEVVISSFIAGANTTVPVKMFTTLRNQIDPTITAISTLLIIVTVIGGIVAAAVLRRRLMSVVGVGN